MKKLVLIALTIVGAAIATPQAQAGISFSIFGGSSHHRGHYRPAPIVVAPRHCAPPSYSHHGHHGYYSRPSYYHRPSYGHHGHGGHHYDRRPSHHGSHGGSSHHGGWGSSHGRH